MDRVTEPPREFAREVNQFLRDGRIDVEAFLEELARQNTTVAQRLGLKKPASGGRTSKES